MKEMAGSMNDALETAGRARLDGVDVLRGLCVLLVLMHHIHLRFVLNDYDVDGVLPGTINQLLFWSGYYAVIAFFVISGFLITRLSIRRWGSTGGVRVLPFYGMRVARIVPCLILLLALLSALHLAGAADFTIKPERASLGRALWSALTFQINWLEGQRGYLPGGWDILWSLSIEEMFYLAFPLACVILRSERLLVGALLCLIAVGPVDRTLLAEQDPWGDYAYLSCMDGIAFGCLAALACAHLRPSRHALRMVLTGGAIAASLVLILCNENLHTGLCRYGLNVTVLEAGIASMLIALGSGVANASMARGTGWLRAIGHASYEIYLFHMLVVLALVNLFKRIQPAADMIPLWYLAMLAISLLLGYAVSKLYSEPLNRLLRFRYLQEVPKAKSTAGGSLVTTGDVK
ncbi:MAG: acyltransferase [Steroidobacteraceae bacterium]